MRFDFFVRFWIYTYLLSITKICGDRLKTTYILQRDMASIVKVTKYFICF